MSDASLDSFKRITIICPVHNEALVIPLFFERINVVINMLTSRYQVQLLFINNASTDATLVVLKELSNSYPFIFFISLSANFGYQKSIECGLRNAKGDIFAFIDVDCEDPPEMLLDFVKAYEKGYDIVYGERLDRHENFLIKWFRNFFYRIARSVADDDFILYMAEFSLFTSEVRDALIIDSSSFPFIRSSIARVGFSRFNIPYKRQLRIAGKTHYNFLSMTIFAVSGILASSTLALRLPIYLLPFWLVSTFFLGALQIKTGSPWFLLINILLASLYVGWTIAFMALYVARSYKNGLGRPNFIINSRQTFFQPD
jgi:glycosyltransferase involved in cell wall biosynthesis